MIYLFVDTLQSRLFCALMALQPCITRSVSKDVIYKILPYFRDYEAEGVILTAYKPP